MANLLGSPELPKMEVKKEDLPSYPTDEKDNSFKLIFAPDELTGRPRSDLGTYFSENTNPLVRDFIERQLRTDFTKGSVAVPEGVSDTDIAYLTRDNKETLEDYTSRVNSYLYRQQQSYGESVARQRVREAIKKRSVEIKSE